MHVEGVDEGVEVRAVVAKLCQIDMLPLDGTPDMIANL
jgi:hypothetical protein